MSHSPQRTETDCLNCGAEVVGRYCHKCGQENVVPKETFWHMVTHFFYDITHFDSKFFETVKDLLFKPGFLSREYMKGRRSSYLHPVKMYVFTSAVFFLLFFSFFTDDSSFKMHAPELISGTERLKAIAALEKKLLTDSLQDPEVQKKLAKLNRMKDTSQPVTLEDFASIEGGLMKINLSGKSRNYKTVQEYDSVQKSLPAKQKDGWFLKRLIRKEISINVRYGLNPQAGFDKLGQLLLHRLPYLLFVSLPLFALILQLLYARRRQFYYADHGIFTIHLYVFTFILLLMVFACNELGEATGWSFMGWIIGLLFLVLNFYLYKAMRFFYGQRRLKTFTKYLLVVLLSLIMMVVLLAIFFFYSAYDL